jgi:hypothetical protein
MDMGKEAIITRAANFCWMRSSLLASVVIIEFQTTEVYLSFDPSLKLNICRDKDKKLKRK